MIRIDLHSIGVASAKGIEVKARGMSGAIGPLARRLLTDRLAKPFEDVMIYRGDTLCFNPAPLIWWASMQTSESFGQSAKTGVYKPMPQEVVQ
jgi:hypothetical protein